MNLLELPASVENTQKLHTIQFPFIGWLNHQLKQLTPMQIGSVLGLRGEHMNNRRRKHIEELIGRLSAIMGEVEDVKDIEQDAFDNMPENLQDAEHGQLMEEHVSNLEDAQNEIEQAIGTLTSITEQ